MTPHQSLLDPLAYMTKNSDPDGVELYFMTDRTSVKSKKSKDLIECIRKITPQNTVDPRIHLGDILHEHIGKIETSGPPATSFKFPNPLKSKFSKQTKRMRPLSIYIMTTGEWQPGCELDETISNIFF